MQVAQVGGIYRRQNSGNPLFFVRRAQAATPVIRILLGIKIIFNNNDLQTCARYFLAHIGYTERFFLNVVVNNIL